MAPSNRRCSPRPRILLLLLLTPLIANGCEAGLAGTGHTVVDSAGVRIVTSSHPAWSDDGWRIEEEPVLDVGLREGDENYLFNRVRAVIRLEDGGIVVANGGDNTIRRYDANGTLVWKTGGTGGGPGEYAAVGRLRLLGDTILALDDTEMQPNHLYDLDGRQIGTVGRYEGDPQHWISVYDVFPDGSYLYSTFPQGRVVKGDRWLDSATVFRVSADMSRTDSLLRLPAVEFAQFDPRMGYPVVFAPIFVMEAGDDVLYADYPDDCDIGVYDFSGREVRSVRWACTTGAIPEEAIERYRREYVNGPPELGGTVPAQLRARREALLAQQQFAERYPAHLTLKADGAGNLWVERVPRLLTRMPDEPTIWDVFNAEDVWLGPVRTPPRFAVSEIGADYVAGIWRDLDDIEHARVYRLIK
jgi:hypothetical protein